MLIAGSDDGAYRLTGIQEPGNVDVQKALESGRTMRLRQFDGIDGVFAATRSGLYHSPDGTDWTNLNVPREKVYAVGASADSERLYAGTRPAHLYVASMDDSPHADLEWAELEGFQEVPSRENWRLPRHEDLAQVRDVHGLPGTADGVVAGVEVGGVHLSTDGGDTWTERNEGVHEDIHELHVVAPSELAAATGYGLFHTADTGRSWTRLDDGVDQRYFRSVLAVDGVLYAAGALANSSTWEDDDAEPELFVSQDAESISPVELPRSDEMVTGMTVVDGTLVVATHRGTVLLQRSEEWVVAGSVPIPGDVTGRYTPLLGVEH